jgi:hypothetical protein
MKMGRKNYWGRTMNYSTKKEKVKGVRIRIRKL